MFLSYKKKRRKKQVEVFLSKTWSKRDVMTILKEPKKFYFINCTLHFTFQLPGIYLVLPPAVMFLLSIWVWKLKSIKIWVNSAWFLLELVRQIKTPNTVMLPSPSTASSVWFLVLVENAVLVSFPNSFSISATCIIKLIVTWTWFKVQRSLRHNWF